MIEINKGETVVEVKVDTSTYLFSKEQYDELWHAMRDQDNYPSDVIWTSVVTDELIEPYYTERLISELDDYVAQTCMNYAEEEN